MKGAGVRLRVKMRGTICLFGTIRGALDEGGTIYG
jgi:hypothetical protein